MPTTFHDREQAFEAKFAHDEEFRFLAIARRDRLFAQWVAATLRLSGEEGDALTKAVLAIPNGPGHDQAVLQYVASLLSGRAGGMSDRDISAALERCAQQARQQLIETPPGRSDAP
jgi:hypothetical protein